MPKFYDSLSDPHREWMGEQHLFFVATAPLDASGHVNLSPKGYDTFRILDENTVAYLDLTGSGIETISHLRENGRITVMFCAFEGRPRILRLYGTGESLLPGEDGFDELAPLFPEMPGARAIVRVRVDKIVSSCGYSVPLMSFEDERETLKEWAERKGDALAEYRDDRNAESIDGLPGLVAHS